MSEQGYQPHPLRNAVAGHIGGGTPSRQVPSYWRGHIPWASVKDFSEQSGLIDDTEEHISTAGLNASASNLIPAGTPLVCTRMAVGRAAMPSMPMAINQDVKALFPVPGVSPAYLLKLLQFIQPKAEAQAVGSTVKGIRIQDYLDIKVPLADTDAQPVIAHVLDTLDTAIHETEAIIAKLKAVKQGLMHDLLTRGIDANGELRPPQAEAPHLYKKSPLGWIPKEWEDTVLGAVTTWASGGTPSRAVPGNWVGPIALLTPKDMKSFEMSDASEHISVKAAQLGSRVMPADTVFIVVRGMILSHTFPVVLGRQPMAFNQDVKAVTAGPHLSGRFLAHWFVANSDHFLRKVTEATHGTKKLDMGDLVSMPIGMPALSEQHAIIERQAAINRQFTGESLYLAQLKALKTGLMDDLLTGRVRVTPLLAEAAQQQASA
jgi:type I restriction enzyme S subunit